MNHFLLKKIPNKYFFSVFQISRKMGINNGKCVSTVRLDGKTAIITGANTGIGKETAKDFFIRGARVVIACRNVEKANSAAEDIRKQCQGLNDLGMIVITELDLMSLNSVRICAEKILQTEKRIDLLINNAGVMMCPEGRTEDGFETQFGTNHLGHFLLTLLLLPRICQSSPARIVNVSSLAHTMGTIHFDDLNFIKRKYNSITAYQQSKLANVLFTQELAKRLKEAQIGVTVYSLHPGVISTELGRHLDDVMFRGAIWIWHNLARWFIKTPKEGAQTSIYCAVDEKCANESGLYYSDCKVTSPGRNAQNKSEDCKKLWEESWKLVKLDENYNPFTFNKI